MLAMPFYSGIQRTYQGWIYMIRQHCRGSVHDLTNDSIASYERLLNSVLSCISAVMQKPTGSMLGIHNNHYTEQLGNTADGHLEISKAFKRTVRSAKAIVKERFGSTLLAAGSP